MGPYNQPEDYLSIAPPPKLESAPSGGASSFLSSVLGSIPIIGNIASAFLTNKWNRDAVEERNRLAIEQWKRENAYNHPLAQMMRLKSAGLNPNLIYGNGASSMLSAKSPEFQSPHYDPVSVDPLTAAQIRNLDAQSQSLEHQTAREDEKQPFALDKLQSDINESAARIRNLDENSRKQYAERLNIKFEQVMRGKEWRDAHNKINAEIRRLNAGSALDEKQFQEMCETFVYRLTGIKLNNQLTQKQIDHYSALIKNLGIEFKVLNQEFVKNLPAVRIALSTNAMYNGSQGVVGDVGSTLYDGVGMFLNLFKGVIHL